MLIENINTLRQSFKEAGEKYKFEIFGIVILPDHIHMLIKPENIKEYPTIIKSIKVRFSRDINIDDVRLTESKIKKKEKGIWQRRYWERTIRNEKDLYDHFDYIHYNPVKHGYVDNVKDWEYSSFHKYVKQGKYDINWGSNNDIQHFIDINTE